MKYSIRYSRFLDRKAMERIPKRERQKIHQAIQAKLTTEPHLFGKPLRNSLKGCRSLRVGDYRIIFRILKAEVDVLHVDHRSVVYKHFQEKYGGV